MLSMSGKQRSVHGLGLRKFTSFHVNVSQIALRSRVIRCDLQPSLQLSCCLIIFLVSRQNSSQLNMWLRLGGTLRNYLPQIVFRLGIPLPAHVNVGEADERILRR